MDGFQRRLTISNPRFIERYIKSELHFLVHFSVGCINEEFVACFQRKQIIGRSEKHGWKVCEEGVILAAETVCKHLLEEWPHMCHEVNTLETGTNGYQQSMLVNDIEAVKYPQSVPLPSLIWLDTAKHIYGVWPKVLYFSLKFGFKVRGALSDDEVIPFLRTGWSVRPDEKQLLSNVIKDASQVVDCISSNGRNAIWHGVSSDYIIDQLAHLRIALGPDFIRLGIKEGFDLGFKIRDVLFGPFNFYLDERNPFIGSHGFGFLHPKNLNIRTGRS